MCEKLRVETIEMVACSLTALDEESKSSTSSNKPAIVGRCFDLKSAYKQFGVDQQRAEMLKIALKAGPGKVNFYDVLALPFGATGSVSAFLRLAASIAFIGVKCLHLVWTVFFDDFTCITPASLIDNTTTCVEGLFKIAETGPKAPPFDVSFKILGLQIDLGDWSNGSFKLQHTDSRKLELVEVMKKILDGKLTTPKELERLHGRLVWFNAYIFGRRILRAISCVSRFARLNASSIPIEDDLMEHLSFLREAIEN